MLPTATIHEIDRLLRAGGLSHRKIAARLGVSHGTVSAIANGRRGLHGKEVDHGRKTVSNAPSTRCPGCGYRVHLPCLVCAARKLKSARTKPAKPPALLGSVLICGRQPSSTDFSP